MNHRSRSLRGYILLIAITMQALCHADTLDVIWRTQGLDAPESIVAVPGKSQYLVSNVNGQGSDRDNNGYIALLSSDGKIIDQDWLRGLHAPKGMAISEGYLYVSDIDHVVVISLKDRSIQKRIAIADAKFLNDVAVAPDGAILVSDSGGARIYRINKGQVDIWLEDEQLSGVNGIWPSDGNILITTMSEGELLSVNYTRPSIRVLSTGMKNADGIIVLADKGYLISAWPGVMYRVDRNGQTHVIQDTTESRIFHNDMLYHEGLILVPNWQPGSVTAYRYKP